MAEKISDLLNGNDSAATKYWISNSFLTGGPTEIIHPCRFSPVVNKEECLGQSETKLCVISCEDIGSKILGVEVLSLEVLITTLESK